jgi:hypothetical protein
MSSGAFRCLSGQTCRRNGIVVRTLGPWGGEVSERRERYVPQPRRVRIGHGLPKTRAPGEHNKHPQTTHAHQPSIKFTHLACILLSALHIGRLFLSLGNVNGHLVRVALFSLSLFSLNMVQGHNLSVHIPPLQHNSRQRSLIF